MKYLLDTHSLLWFLTGDDRLSARTRQVMDDEMNELFISIASLWEIAIKVSIGKLHLSQPFDRLFPVLLEINSIGVLGITVEHTKRVCELPLYHRDPFDRIIVAQAQSEQLLLISADSRLDSYGIQRIW